MPYQPTEITWKNDTLTEQLVDGLAAEWLDLATAASEKNVYYFPWFIAASLHLEAMQNASVVRVYQGNVLIGLWVAKEDFGYAKLPVLFDRSVLHPHQFLGTPLVRKGAEEAFVYGWMDWLDRAPGSRSFVLLPMFNGQGPLFSALTAFCIGQGRAHIELERSERAALLPKGSKKQSAIAKINKSRARSLLRRKGKLAELGDVTVEYLQAHDDIAPWLEDFMRVENQGWKKDEGTSILQNPADIALYEKMAPAAFAHGHLKFVRLKVDERPIAYALDLACGEFVYCLKCSHDRAYRKYSPGVLLEYESLKNYDNSSIDYVIDSCTAPDNAMLNDLFPDQKPFVTILIPRKGLIYTALFRLINFLKSRSTSTP